MTELEQKLRDIADEKDLKILPENIKKDVEIFDVTGTYEGSSQEINNQDKEITENGTYTADEGYTGLGTVTVNVPQEGGSGDVKLFVQTTEPENKNGIWVKTDTQYENKIAVQNALSETGEYTKLADIPYMFYYGSAVAIGTDIYLLGGSSSQNNYKYDILTDTYTQLKNIPYTFHYGDAVAIGTDIYLLGGSSSQNNNYKYDTLTDTYSRLKNIPYDFTHGSAVAIGTDIYLLGGVGLDLNYKYNTLTDTYTKLADIPYMFYYGSAVAIGTDIYLLGGSSSQNNYKYDILTDTYTQLKNIPYTFHYGDAVAIGTDIYLLGGADSSNLNYKYNTLTDTYIQLANIPYNFTEGSAVAIGTDIYTLGGENISTYNYKFTLSLQNDIPNNSLILEQAGSLYKTILFDSDFTNGIEYKFTNVWLKNADGTIDITTPVYYGNGTQWIKFNGEVDN